MNINDDEITKVESWIARARDEIEIISAQKRGFLRKVEDTAACPCQLERSGIVPKRLVAELTYLNEQHRVLEDHILDLKSEIKSLMKKRGLINDMSSAR